MTSHVDAGNFPVYQGSCMIEAADQRVTFQGSLLGCVYAAISPERRFVRGKYRAHEDSRTLTFSTAQIIVHT